MALDGRGLCVVHCVLRADWVSRGADWLDTSHFCFMEWALGSCIGASGQGRRHRSEGHCEFCVCFVVDVILLEGVRGGKGAREGGGGREIKKDGGRRRRGGRLVCVSRGSTGGCGRERLAGLGSIFMCSLIVLKMS